MNDALSHSCPRPASPFFRHRPLGRAPSPPTWACYEQIPARSDLLGSSSDSDSDSCDAADEDSLSDADSSSSSSDADDAAEAEAEAEVAGLMDVESDKDDDDAVHHRYHPDDVTATESGTGDPEKRDKGKQRAEDVPTPTGGKSVPVAAHPRRPPMNVLRPILTIQRSQGFVWNQDLFVPPYIKDRYIASTSPPTSTGTFSACASTSTSLGDYEIEVVEIRVRDGELDDIIP
ncbi:hypothetical protein BC827DRAFT_1261921 [Russula dissimulans]|nr:hypothetical protein BC827DRAFT_1261921 [Russula dissimulans]